MDIMADRSDTSDAAGAPVGLDMAEAARAATSEAAAAAKAVGGGPATTKSPLQPSHSRKVSLGEM